jgi:hypothetical protein
LEDVVAVAQEAADAGHLDRLLGLQHPPRAATGGRDLVAAAVVDLERRDGLVDRGVEVVVEVAAERRVPREVPALAHPVVVELRERCARDGRERRVADVQMLDQARRAVVGVGRATRAAVVPRGIEHEVQLPAGGQPFLSR